MADDKPTEKFPRTRIFNGEMKQHKRLKISMEFFHLLNWHDDVSGYSDRVRVRVYLYICLWIDWHCSSVNGTVLSFQNISSDYVEFEGAWVLPVEIHWWRLKRVNISWVLASFVLNIESVAAANCTTNVEYLSNWKSKMCWKLHSKRKRVIHTRIYMVHVFIWCWLPVRSLSRTTQAWAHRVFGLWRLRLN